MTSQSLSSGDGLRHPLHASAYQGDYNQGYQPKMVKKPEKVEGQKKGKGGLCREPGGQAPSGREPAPSRRAQFTENFCIFYLKKVIFCVFNCIICCNNALCSLLCIIQTENALTCDNHFPLAHSEFGKGGLKSGVWGRRPQPSTKFYGFHIKNTHSSTFFYRKRASSERSHNGQCKNIFAAYV